MTTGKTIVLARRTFVDKVMSLLFNMLLSAAASKSLQSCQTLCDLIDGSPPGSRPWDSPEKNTGVGCHFPLRCMKVKSLKMKSFSHVRLFTIPWTAAYQAPPSMGFSRQEYWIEVPLPSPKSDREGQILYDSAYMWNQKKNSTMSLFIKQKWTFSMFLNVGDSMAALVHRARWK